jgi:hypothetical protein
MRITDPVLVPDVSLWCDHINAKEFEDGGCQSVVVGLYPVSVNGKWQLNPTCRNQCLEVAKTSMVLQAYYWDDIIIDPVRQANWVADTIQAEGLPVKFVWADDEQWWTDWAKWANARAGKIPMASVPHATPGNIYFHMLSFVQTLRSRFPQTGVYTNNGFVASWAPDMNNFLPLYPAWVAEYAHEPKVITAMTWAQLKANWLPNYDIALAPGQIPSMVKGHQFTGDLIELPGAYDQYGREQTLDVSVFSKAFIDGLRGGIPTPNQPPKPPIPAPQPLGTAYSVIYPRINVRAAPSGSAEWVRYAVLNEIVQVVKIENGWAQLTDGTFIFADYIKKI